MGTALSTLPSPRKLAKKAAVVLLGSLREWPKGAHPQALHPEYALPASRLFSTVTELLLSHGFRLRDTVLASEEPEVL
jgi:hypothetical protein